MSTRCFLNCSHSQSLMAAATAINAEAFTNQEMAENNSANCLNANGLEPRNKHLDKETVTCQTRMMSETQGKLTNCTFRQHRLH